MSTVFRMYAKLVDFRKAIQVMESDGLGSESGLEIREKVDVFLRISIVNDTNGESN